MSSSNAFKERMLQKIVNDFYNEFYFQLITEYVDKLDVLQKEKEIVDSQYEFVTMISHQLRTPISVIRWNVELLGEDEKLKEGLHDVFEKVDTLNSLVNNLLYFIEIGGEYKVEELDEIKLTDLVNKAVDDLINKASEKNVKMKFSKPLFNDKALVNKKGIDKVLFYLLDNAVIYNKEKGRVEISMSRYKDMVKVAIKDTGIGIPKNEQPRVFSKFFRASNASLGKNEGSGVSLYLAKMIIERHGGRMGFKSAEGKGSTFFFTLPCEHPTKK